MRIQSNDVELEVELRGPEAGRPLVLVRGLGTQMIQWPEPFLARLEAAGQRLVLFDNRDAGLSTHLHGAGRPNLGEIFEALGSGSAPPVPYTLNDMADDVAALLDGVGIESAHVAGMSMGGMIVQQFAARHPARTRSLVSIMSATGNPSLPPPTDAARDHLLAPAPQERSAYIDHHVAGSKVFGSPGFPIPVDQLREIAGRVYDRAFDPEGVARQFAAIQAGGDRRGDLATIGAPTLVIHGVDDPLIRVDGGRDTAATIPGAELLEIPGMGHDHPPGLLGTLADAISGHTEKAEA